MKTNLITLITPLLISAGTVMAQCPDTLSVWQTGCGQVEASINHFGSAGNLIWTWGDGESSTAANPSTHQYDALGTYEICAQAWSSGCPQGVELCVLFELEQCPEDCGLSISTVSQGDGLLTLLASNFPADAWVHWEQNGEIINIGEETTFELEFGDNEICSYYETPECPQGVFWCNNYFFQNPDCPTAIQAQQVGCDVYDLSIVGGFSGANVLWSFGSEEIEGDTELSGVQLPPGNIQVTAVYSHPDYPLCDNTELSLNVNALLCDSICELELVHTTVSLNPIFFSAMTYDPGASVTWTVNGNPAGEGDNFTLANQVAGGTYIICASYDSEYCDEVIEECVTISFPDCPTGITAEQLFCGVYEVILENAQEGSTIQWSYPGNSFESDESPQIVILEDWFNSITAVYNNPDNPQCNGSTYSQIVIHTSCDSVCTLDVDLIEGADGDMFIAHTLQTDAVIEWSIGGEPVTFGDTLNLGSLSPGQYLICAAYETPFCPAGVFWCDTYIVGNDDCPFELIVEEADECGCYNFSINPPQIGGTFMWNLGDTSFVTLTPTASACYEAGFQTMYVQIMGSNNPDCEAAPLVHQWEVPDCDEPACPAELIVTETDDCGCYDFVISPSDIGSEYHWNLAGNVFTTNAWSFTECFEAGFQTAYVQIMGSDNPECEIAPLAHEWVVPECEDECPFELMVEETSACGCYSFTINGPAGNEFMWNLGDSVFVSSDYAITHCYEPGFQTMYTQSLSTEYPECDAPLVHQWEVPDCGGCSLGLNATYLGGGLYDYEAFGLGSGALTWDFGNGYTDENEGWSAQHIYLPGNYTVCVLLNDTACSEVLEACVEIEVPDDDCYWIGGIWGITAPVQAVALDVMIIGDDENFMGGFNSWMEGDTLWMGGEWCVAPGCYTITVTSEFPLTPELIEPQLWPILPDVIPVNIYWSENNNPYEWEATLEILADCADGSVGMEETPLDAIRVYPVPTRDLVQVDFFGMDVVDCVVFNAMGQPVYSRSLQTNERISLSHLSAGLYIMQFRYQDQIETFSIPLLD